MGFWNKQVRAGLKGGLLLLLAVASLLGNAAGGASPSGKKSSQAILALSTSAKADGEEAINRLMIGYKTGAKLAGQGGVTAATESREAAMQVARTANLSTEHRLRYLKSVSASLHVVGLEQPLSGADAERMMQRLRADPNVAEVVVDRRVKPYLVPNDPLYVDASQWHLQNSSLVPGGMNMSSAWDTTKGLGVVVAVIDSGYRPHADLVANVLPGYDFISADVASSYGGNAFWTANDGNARDNDAQDPGNWITSADVTANYCSEANDSTWHGTHVAGLVGAVGNNGSGGLGVAYGAKILPVRVLGRCGGYVSDILAGARWAVGLDVPGVPTNTNRAKVLNLSLGATAACDSISQGIVTEVRNLDVSVVAATGNNGSATISFPANCSGVMAVTAHTREGDSADYANVGPGTRISAPGGGNNTTLSPTSLVNRAIPSTGNAGSTTPAGDVFQSMQGTSMATPQVSGVLALLASLRRGVGMAELEGYVLNSARAFPAGGYCATNPDTLTAGFCGSGLLDAQAAAAALAAARPDLLKVDLQVSPTAAPQGQTVAVTISLSNLGAATAPDITLTYAVGSGLIIQGPGDFAGATLSNSSNQATATLSALAAGQSAEWKLTVLAADISNSLSSTATAATSAVDPYLADNSDTRTLVPIAAPVSASNPVASSGGGGCTAAINGQSDAALVFLALFALLMMGLRRRQPR